MVPFSLQQLIVKAGDLIRVGPWNGLIKFLRSLRLVAGEGVALRETPNGTLIRFDGNNNNFLHPFKCSLQGNSGVRVRPGLVDGKMPTISVDGRDIPLDGGKDDDEPTLEWNEKPDLDDQGKGFVALEVRCKLPGYVLDKVLVVQVADLLKSIKDDELKARHPIGLLRKKKDGTLKLWQTTHFSLAHRVAKTKDKPARHFFWAV